MISNLKKQEIEIEEVTETIYENINKYRADLRFSLPEMKRVLDDLLHEHYSDTRHLVRELGEVHPMAILWEQRVEETVKVVNGALYLIRITMRNFEEDLDAWQESSSTDGTLTATQVHAAEVGAASLLQADTALRPQDAPSEGGQQREKAQPVAGLQAADATQLANQVHVNTTIEASCASPHSPVGKVASGGHPATLEVAPRFQPAADVAQFNNRTAGTTPPAAKQVVATTVNPTELVGISASHRGQGSSRQSSTETALRYCEEDNKSGELHVEAQAAASDTMQPALDQVYICSVKYNDAAYNLPVGYVTSGPQAAQQAESGEPHEEEHAAETETVQPALDQAAPAEAAAADTIKPAVVQVIVCSIELDDAASNLPVGYVPSGGTSRVDTGTATTHEDAPACALLSGVEHEASRAAGSLTATQVQAAEVGTASRLQADTALRPQVAPPEDGQQYEEAQPVAGLQAADATQQDTPRTAGTKPPAAEQVTMTTVISTELVGSSASQNGQGSPRQSSTETGHEAKSADTTKLKVKDESYNTKDTASDSPIGKPVPPTTLPSSGTALGLLDTLLARSRTVQRKLDRMTIPPADVKTVLARGPSMPAGQPVAILDKCLAQSQLLLQKMDKLSAKAKAKSLIPTLNAEVVLPTSPRQEQKVPTPQAQAALLASQQEVYQFPPLQAEVLPASQQEKYQCPILQAEVVLPASQQEEYQCPILQAEVVLPASQQEVYQFPILQTEVLPASQQEEYQCPILQEELVLSTSQQEEHQLPTLQAKLVLSTSHRQFALPTLATANEAAEADKPSHILVSCLAQASPAAQKRDNLSTSRHYYGHGPSHQKLDKTGGLPAPVQSAGTKGVNGHQNWKDDRFKGSILAQADTATQVWATGDIVADTDSPARRAAQENADSTQVRGLQELGCIDKSRHADLDADRGVSDPIAKQPDLDTDLQVLVGLDRGLEAGHRTLGHTDSFHRSSDPDKRNKVNKSKEYLSSLMMDHLPPCFSGSQPEWNQCWYDTSTRVDSEGSTATNITVRVSMECIRSPTCINLHPAEKVGSTVVAERPRMVRVICRKAKKYNYAHLNPDAQLLQIRELSRQPSQEADCILLTTRQQADVLLTNLQADVLLTSKQADVLLTTLQADVLLTTKQADVLPTTLQADVLLTTKQADVLLTTQQADVQLADCVLLSIQKPVVHRDSVLNHADDQVVLLSSQQEDISNGSLIHIVTCIGAAVTEAKIQVAPVAECCAGGVIISMQHPDLQSHSKSPAKATAAEDACSIPQSNKWRKFIITESEAEQVMGPATKIKSNNTMISDEKSNSVPTFSAAHDEDEVAVKHEEAVNSSLSSPTVETAGMVTSATSTSGEAASNSLGKRKFKTSILGGIEIHQVERVPEMETVIDKVGEEIIISDAVPDIDLTSRAGSSISPRTLSSEKQASDQESKDEAAPKKTKTQSTDQNNCNTYPNVEVCKLVSATQQAECGQLSIQQCQEEFSILGAECSLLSIQQVNTGRTEIRKDSTCTLSTSTISTTRVTKLVCVSTESVSVTVVTEDDEFEIEEEHYDENTMPTELGQHQIVPAGWKLQVNQSMLGDPQHILDCYSGKQLGHLRETSQSGKRKVIQLFKDHRETNVPADNPVKAAVMSDNDRPGWTETEDKNVPGGWFTVRNDNKHVTAEKAQIVSELEIAAVDDFRSRIVASYVVCSEISKAPGFKAIDENQEVEGVCEKPALSIARGIGVLVSSAGLDETASDTVDSQEMKDDDLGHIEPQGVVFHHKGAGVQVLVPRVRVTPLGEAHVVGRGVDADLSEKDQDDELEVGSHYALVKTHHCYHGGDTEVEACLPPGRKMFPCHPTFSPVKTIDQDILHEFGFEVQHGGHLQEEDQHRVDKLLLASMKVDAEVGALGQHVLEQIEPVAFMEAHAYESQEGVTGGLGSTEDLQTASNSTYETAPSYLEREESQAGSLGSRDVQQLHELSEMEEVTDKEEINNPGAVPDEALAPSASSSTSSGPLSSATSMTKELVKHKSETSPEQSLANNDKAAPRKSGTQFTDKNISSNNLHNDVKKHNSVSGRHDRDHHQHIVLHHHLHQSGASGNNIACQLQISSSSSIVSRVCGDKSYYITLITNPSVLHMRDKVLLQASEGILGEQFSCQDDGGKQHTRRTDTSSVEEADDLGSIEIEVSDRRSETETVKFKLEVRDSLNTAPALSVNTVRLDTAGQEERLLAWEVEIRADVVTVVGAVPGVAKEHVYFAQEDQHSLQHEDGNADKSDVPHNITRTEERLVKNTDVSKKNIGVAMQVLHGGESLENVESREVDQAAQQGAVADAGHVLVKGELFGFTLDHQGWGPHLQCNHEPDHCHLVHGEVMAPQGAGHHHHYRVLQLRHHHQSQDNLQTHPRYSLPLGPCVICVNTSRLGELEIWGENNPGLFLLVDMVTKSKRTKYGYSFLTLFIEFKPNLWQHCTTLRDFEFTRNLEKVVPEREHCQDKFNTRNHKGVSLGTVEKQFPETDQEVRVMREMANTGQAHLRQGDITQTSLLHHGHVLSQLTGDHVQDLHQPQLREILQVQKLNKFEYKGTAYLSTGLTNTPHMRASSTNLQQCLVSKGVLGQPVIDKQQGNSLGGHDQHINVDGSLHNHVEDRGQPQVDLRVADVEEHDVPVGGECDNLVQVVLRGVPRIYHIGDPVWDEQELVPGLLDQHGDGEAGSGLALVQQGRHVWLQLQPHLAQMIVQESHQSEISLFLTNTMLSTESGAVLTSSSVYMVTSLATVLMRAHTNHLSGVINDRTTEVHEFSMELVKQDSISQRVKEEMKCESFSGCYFFQHKLCNACAMAMSCIISLHYCRKVTTLSSSNVAVTELIPSPASGKVNLLSSFMNEAINGSSMSQGVATSRLCDTVHGQGHHLQHDQGHQLLPDDEAGPVQQVYPSTISIGWAEKGYTSANSMDCSSLLYNKVEDYAVAHALLHIAREEVGSCQDILYRHVLEPQLLQGRIQASFLFILKQKLTRYFPETGPDHEDCHHARVPQPPALQGHHHHRCRDVQREQGQGPET